VKIGTLSAPAYCTFIGHCDQGCRFLLKKVWSCQQPSNSQPTFVNRCGYASHVRLSIRAFSCSLATPKGGPCQVIQSSIFTLVITLTSQSKPQSPHGNIRKMHFKQPTKIVRLATSVPRQFYPPHCHTIRVSFMRGRSSAGLD
jgi:hypothetical protein